MPSRSLRARRNPTQEAIQLFNMLGEGGEPAAIITKVIEQYLGRPAKVSGVFYTPRAWQMRTGRKEPESAVLIVTHSIDNDFGIMGWFYHNDWSKIDGAITRELNKRGYFYETTFTAVDYETNARVAYSVVYRGYPSLNPDDDDLLDNPMVVDGDGVFEEMPYPYARPPAYFDAAAFDVYARDIPDDQLDQAIMDATSALNDAVSRGDKSAAGMYHYQAGTLRFVKNIRAHARRSR